MAESDPVDANTVNRVDKVRHGADLSEVTRLFTGPVETRVSGDLKPEQNPPTSLPGAFRVRLCERDSCWCAAAVATATVAATGLGPRKAAPAGPED